MNFIYVVNVIYGKYDRSMIFLDHVTHACFTRNNVVHYFKKIITEISAENMLGTTIN